MPRSLPVRAPARAFARALTWPFTAAALFAALAAADAGAARSVAERLVPVLGFAAGMSVVVNLASAAGAFEAVTGWMERRAPSAGALWAGFIGLCVLSTVFLSLDTTAIMLTPLAVAVARRSGLGVPSLALAVVWIANLASLPLPVSNLTNLLALGGGAFGSTHDYARHAWAPAAAGVAVAVAASFVVRLADHRRSPGTPSASAGGGSHPALTRRALAVLGVTLPALLTPLPYWATSSAAAVAMALAVGVGKRGALPASPVSWLPLIPWSSLALAAALSAAATLGGALGLTAGFVDILRGAGPLTLAGAGAVAANAINNLPAYLALEPAASGADGSLALLVGVNLGPLVTPWASLATLLWHDQLTRAGVHLSWARYAAWGAVLAPVAVAAAAATI